MGLNQQAQRMLNSVPSQHCSIQGLLRAHIRYCRWYLTPQCNTTPNENWNGNGITDIQMHYSHSCLHAFAYIILSYPLLTLAWDALPSLSSSQTSGLLGLFFVRT